MLAPSSPSSASPAPAAGSPTRPGGGGASLIFNADTIRVNSRVQGQRVAIADRDFEGGVMPERLVQELLKQNREKPIVTLILKKCKLAALPRELSQLGLLYELDVSDNALTDLPVDLVALTSLVKLNLSGNQFKELPVFVGHLPSLLHLQVNSMPSLILRDNLKLQGTEAICAFLRSSFVAIEEKQEELERNVRETLNVAKHADICFKVDGELIYAHRLILTLRITSPIIETMLASPNKEHEISGVRAAPFLSLLKFAYGNGLYDPMAEGDKEFIKMLDTLQISTFGRNQRVASGAVAFICNTNVMLHQDLACLHHKMTQQGRPQAPTPSDGPNQEGQNASTSGLARPAPKKGKRLTRAEREMQRMEKQRALEIEQKKQALQAEGEEDKYKLSELNRQLQNESLLRQHEWFSDILFRCVGQQDEAGPHVETLFRCHKFLLCARSPYFQAKFEGGMADALDREILVDEFEGDSFSQMLRFLYTDDATVHADNAVDLLAMSGHYQLDRLRSIAEKFIGENIDHENVLSILQVADHYQAYQLKVFCTSYVLKNREKIVGTEEWRTFKAEQPELCSQLTKLLMS